MTILTVMQNASMAVGLARPLAVFASTDREWREMQSVANEAAAGIAAAFDWQRLRKVHSFDGNGTDESYPLPEDYLRMLKSGSMWSSRLRWSLNHVVDADQWLEMTSLGFPQMNGNWTLFGDRLQMLPPVMSGETIKFFYVTSKIVKDGEGSGKPEFTDDGDSFVLSERLLKLAIIYLWKQLKGLDFAAELADFEQAMDQHMIADQGSQPIRSGNSGAGRRGSNVWPGTVSG